MIYFGSFKVFLRVAEQNTQDELPDEVKRSRLEDLTDSK